MVNDLSIVKGRIKPLALDPGDTFQAAVKVKNLSPRKSKNTDVRVYLSKTETLAENAVYLGRQKLGPLNPLQKKTLRFKKSLNASLAAGTYYLITVVDSKAKNNDPVQENNWGVGPKKVVIR
jgi:hypothetical protein